MSKKRLENYKGTVKEIISQGHLANLIMIHAEIHNLISAGELPKGFLKKEIKQLEKQLNRYSAEQIAEALVEGNTAIAENAWNKAEVNVSDSYSFSDIIFMFLIGIVFYGLFFLDHDSGESEDANNDFFVVSSVSDQDESSSTNRTSYSLSSKKDLQNDDESEKGYYRSWTRDEKDSFESNPKSTAYDTKEAKIALRKKYYARYLEPFDQNTKSVMIQLLCDMDYRKNDTSVKRVKLKSRLNKAGYRKLNGNKIGKNDIPGSGFTLSECDSWAKEFYK